tara:strand:- start:370 stop:816 length:447 start_codon:yes stop_codon:yes gene_type:complete
MKKIIYLFIFVIFFQAVYSSNSNYVMLKNNEVNVRYGPGFSYPIKFKYNKRFFPLKVLDKKENFRKVIDFKKNSGWIHWSQLKEKNKSFILLKNQILFSKPTKYSKPIAKIYSGRLLLAKKCKLKWCKVKTDEYEGWITTDNLWGNFE